MTTDEHHDGDEDEAVDKEWEDWMRLVAQKQREQAFYPSPLVQEEDDRSGPGAPPMPVAAVGAPKNKLLKTMFYTNYQ